MIEDQVVCGGVYCNALGRAYDSDEIVTRMRVQGTLTVYTPAKRLIGTIIQLRRLNGHLEALIDTPEKSHHIKED